jgi:hypothetical protein
MMYDTGQKLSSAADTRSSLVQLRTHADTPVNVYIKDSECNDVCELRQSELSSDNPTQQNAAMADLNSQINQNVPSGQTLIQVSTVDNGKLTITPCTSKQTNGLPGVYDVKTHDCILCQLPPGAL